MSKTLDPQRLPKHVAIVMDGNGRWAKSRGMARTQGHLEGVKRVEENIEYASKTGIKVLTLFTFSTENWSRPKSEVSMLMSTLAAVLNRKIPVLNKENIRFSTIGREDRLAHNVLKTIKKASDATKNNTGLFLNIALDYGAREEILQAVRSLGKKIKNGQLNPSNITEEIFSQYLYTNGLPDPDFMIRTSGEYRISNFLLWQLTYAEFYFTEKHWPDFNKDEFRKALLDYQKRTRRFGNI